MDSQLPNLSELSDLVIKKIGTPRFPTPLSNASRLYVDDQMKVPINALVKSDGSETGQRGPAFEIAGPRRSIFFDPTATRCAIVTCGGLCPGLNDVIRSIVWSLSYQYGIESIIGYRYGYLGLRKYPLQPAMKLDPDVVDEIHNDGGTILASSRGNPTVDEMVDTLVRDQISALFVIGGDGTFSGAHALALEIEKRQLPIAIIGIPKTIDNDIYCVERTFGMSTAVAVAKKVISCAHAEAKGAYNGIGLVKLMGRESGFIAAYATLANSDVNFCLVPEENLQLEGKNGFLQILSCRLAKKQHAVIVVAEGVARQIPGQPADIGIFLKEKISDYFKSRDIPISLKYIDPSYTIRSVPANADDSAFCLLLGQYAVHAAMSGRTDMFVSYWNQHFTHVPFTAVIGKSKTT